MSKKLVVNANALVNGKLREKTSVLIENGKIADANYLGKVPDNVEIINADGNYLLPAFIELHAHGGGGADFADMTSEAFNRVMKTHFSHGVTLLCPTLVACEWKKTIDFLVFCDNIARRTSMFGGVHLEGPFLSPLMCGAQNLSNIITPTARAVDELSEFSYLLSCITAAPETDGVEYLAKRMTSLGVGLSVGHSNADAPVMQRAAEWGFSRITHLYSSTSRRDKQGSYVIGGIEESALIDNRFTVELIGDGHHVCRESFLLTEKCKGRDGVVLVSDAMRAAGCEGLTQSYLGIVRPENKVLIEDGVAKLPDRSSFAGSVGVGDTMVRALCGRYGIPIETVSHMMSAAPAKMLSLDKRGKIENGFDAELVILDKNYKTQRVISSVTEYTL